MGLRWHIHPVFFMTQKCRLYTPLFTQETTCVFKTVSIAAIKPLNIIPVINFRQLIALSTTC